MSSPATISLDQADRGEVTADRLRAEIGCLQYNTAQLARRVKGGSPATPAELTAIAAELTRLAELAHSAAADAEARLALGVR